MEKIYDDANWGLVGKDIVTSRFYQAFRVDGLYQGGDDEGTWYEFDSEEKSTISLDPTYPNYEFNKYGKVEEKFNEESGINLPQTISVTITANASLKSEHKNAIVKIDNKEYDLAILDNPVKLFMNKDHRISIFWTPELVERFRVIKL